MKNGDQTAFPVHGGNHNFGIPFPGMTKREYFAGLAMQGALANDNGPAGDWKQLAEHAVSAADALLFELEQ